MRRAALAAALLVAGAAAAEDTRYVAASSLNLRAAPDATAAVAARWRINQPLQLIAERGRWCEVAAPGGAPRGHVDCTFLARTPVTRAQVEAEAAEAALAVLRLGTLDAWTTAFTKDAAETRRQLDALLTQFDRHFALSPSLHTYREADALLRQLATNRGDDEALRPWLAARGAQLAAMRAGIAGDYARDLREPLQHGALGALAALVDRRQAKARAKLGERALPRPLAPSFFGPGRWAIGWAGGPLAGASPAKGGDGTHYGVVFDASNVAALAPLLEMAKAQRAAVRATWGELKPEGHELVQARPSAGGAVETLRLDTRLAAWAVTPQGLRPAQLLGAQYEGGACAGEDGRTQADVHLPGTPPERVLAVFATNVPLDATRATVKVEKRRFLAPLWDLFENSLTERETMSVDLDGDGVPDLRVVVSQDSAVGQSGAGPQRVALRRTGGWYANDVFSLEANVGGEWQLLSVYAVVTCT